MTGAVATPVIAATLAVLVRFGGEAGSDAFRADLERGIEDALVANCFAHVIPAGDDPAAASGDLVLTVVLDHVRDETRFDDSIAEALKPGQPERELRREARFAVDVAATLSARATGALVLTRSFRADATRRPLIIGEDPQAYARSQAIERIVSEIRRGLCSAKAVRRIAEAVPQPAAR
jgi:hypothetical protein